MLPLVTPLLQLLLLPGTALGQESFGGLGQDSFGGLGQDSFGGQQQESFSARAQESFVCPDHLLGFFPHETSCDRYWQCEDSVAILKTCGNGLGFDDTDPNYEREHCDYLHNIDCGDRLELEPPLSTPNCQRPYGIFPDEQSCNTFWSCWAGVANRYVCPTGLAYHRQRRICDWADLVPECKAEEEEGQFQCPPRRWGSGTYGLYPNQEDCRLYYVCMSGGAPREYGCPIGTVFKISNQEGFGVCSDPAKVEGCEAYYEDVDVVALKAQGF